MKFARRMLALTLVMVPVLAAAQLSSNNGDKLVAQVPFRFVVADKHVPAGECIVQAPTMNGRTLVIRNVAAKVSLLSLASLGETKKAAGGYALVFHKYGDKYFLTGIKLAGTRTVYQLAETKAEAELQAQNKPGTETLLLASLQ